jgi:RNA polymerase sigma-70 factor (ECF subfamily)
MFGFRWSKKESSSTFQQNSLEHIDSLYSTALRLCANEKDAEDLVQDTYLKALRFRDKFQEGTNLKAWLFKILTNTFINKYRRKVRERRVLDDTDSSVALEEASYHIEQSNPERDYFTSVLSKDLQQALDALPTDFRMAVVLADVEEFSYREIADIMECPIGTVMSRIFRGRRLLQRQLLGQAEESGFRLAPQEESVEEVEPTDLQAYRARRKLG